MQHSLTKWYLRNAAMAFGALLFLISEASANRIALVVGNANYAEKPLANPRNDAYDVTRELQRLGFIVHSHVDLGRRDMNEALRKFSVAASRAELALVYYSGHGLQAGGENFLVPVDARIQDERDIRSEGIALRDVMSDLDEAKVKRVIVVLDACRDNPFASRSRSVKRGLARPDLSVNASLVAFATAEGRTADDGTGRNGVYTTELLQQMRRDQDIRDVFDETSLAVARRNGDQRPKIYGDTGLFKGVFLSVRRVSLQPSAVASLPRTVSPEEEAWDEIKTSNNVQALNAFLREFPDGAYASRVRTRLASLFPSPVSLAEPSPRPATTNTPAPPVRNSGNWLDR